MAEKRPNGSLTQRGKLWSLTYSVNVLKPDGSIERARRREPIGQIAKMDEATARRKADEFMAKLSSTVSAGVTLREFVEGPFQQDHIDFLKHAGKQHYKNMLNNHVLPALGDRKLAQVNQDHVQELIRLKSERYSPQTCEHIKNTISAIFRRAIEKRIYNQVNPAQGVRMPEMKRKEKFALTLDQASQFIRALPTPVREMALLSITTSLNRAEMLGLRWGRVNLTEKPAIADGHNLPPHSLRVAENCFQGRFGSVKCSTRERIVPLPQVVVDGLAGIKAKAKWTDPTDLVFRYEGARRGMPEKLSEKLHEPERGRAMNCRMVERKILKPVAEEVGMPWISWHVLRRSFATIADQLNWTVADRIASMGHGQFRTTLMYTQADVERRRASAEEMAEKLQLEGAKKGEAA